MRHLCLALLATIPLSGCGVLLPYMYDAGVLDDRLALSMSKVEVLKQLGKPDRIVQDRGEPIVWEYQFYAKREWVSYLIHCPFHPNCYFPAEPPSPYYVALQNDQLCLWGTPDVVRTLAWKVCPSGFTGHGLMAGRQLAKGGLQISVIPVFMPRPLSPVPHRLAVLPARGEVDDRLASWLDLTLNFLRSRHSSLVFVEREDLGTIFDEVEMQYRGRVDEETAARVGKLTGADSFLLYRLNITQSSGAVSASFELRVIRVENGITLFRQLTTTTATASGPETGKVWVSESPNLAYQLVLEEAAAYGLAALAAAFGDNPLGIVPDHTWARTGVKLLGLLEGGPALRSGLKQGDRILNADGRPFRYWSVGVSLPAVLSVERDGATLDISVVPHLEVNPIDDRN